VYVVVGYILSCGCIFGRAVSRMVSPGCAQLLCWVHNPCNAALLLGRCHVSLPPLADTFPTVGSSCGLGCGGFRRARLQLQTRTLAEESRRNYPRGISYVPFMQCYLQLVGWCLGTICAFTCATCAFRVQCSAFTVQCFHSAVQCSAVPHVLSQCSAFTSHLTRSHCVAALHGLQSLCMTASGVLY